VLLAVLLAAGVLAAVLALTQGGQESVLHAYVDCSARSNGNGSLRQPWNRPGSANGTVIRPGGSLLLRRGTRCRGTLAPHGSGRAGAPIVIGSYGAGPPARVDASGGDADAVRLVDESDLIVQDLEVINRGDYASPRRGVHVVGSPTRPGTVHDVVIRRVYVHDVDGSDGKGPAGSGGIQVDFPTRNVVIENNRIENVNRTGIAVVGSGLPPRPPASQKWPSATTGVVIRRNVVRHIGGDGIVPTGTVGAVVADNVVCCGNTRGRPGVQSDAGIWTFMANGTLIEHNVVYGMVGARADGTGYDIDYDQDGTVLQGNYGQGNAGGFVLLCTDGTPRHADVRFNLSVGEYAISPSQCRPPGQPPGSLGGVRVYNNTFVTPSSKVWLNDSSLVSSLPTADDFEFTNNIVYGTRRNLSPLPCGKYCSHNLFWNMPPAGRKALHANPRFAGHPDPGPPRVALASAFRLRADSPALAAGTHLAGAGSRDYFGTPVPKPPAIGFAQP
jgi:Right handed beta helix region